MGVIKVVPITTIRVGTKSSGVIIPLWRPRFVVIKATSPRDIIPIPIWRHSEFFNPQSLAVMPQPITFPKIAVMNNKIVNKSMLELKVFKFTAKPTLAKKMGVSK